MTKSIDAGIRLPSTRYGGTTVSQGNDFKTIIFRYVPNGSWTEKGQMLRWDEVRPLIPAQE